MGVKALKLNCLYFRVKGVNINEGSRWQRGWKMAHLLRAVSYSKLLQSRGENPVLPKIWIYVCNPVIFKQYSWFYRCFLNIIWAQQNISMGLIYLWAVTWRPLFQALTTLVRKKKSNKSLAINNGNIHISLQVFIWHPFDRFVSCSLVFFPVIENSFMFKYLFDYARYELQHLGSSSLIRDQTLALCLWSTES